MFQNVCGDKAKPKVRFLVSQGPKHQKYVARGHNEKTSPMRSQPTKFFDLQFLAHRLPNLSPAPLLPDLPPVFCQKKPPYPGLIGQSREEKASPDGGCQYLTPKLNGPAGQPGTWGRSQDPNRTPPDSNEVPKDILNVCRLKKKHNHLVKIPPSHFRAFEDCSFMFGQRMDENVMYPLLKIWVVWAWRTLNKLPDSEVRRGLRKTVPVKKKTNDQR